MKKLLAIIISTVMGLTSFGMMGSGSNAATKRNETQKFANVVIFVYMTSDAATEAADKAFFENEKNVKEIMKEYDGSHGRSMTNYMKTISYGQFELHNIFPQYDEKSGTITPYKVSVKKTDAKTGDVDVSVIGDILKKNPDVGKEVIDYDNDGCVDNLTVVIRDETANPTGGGNGVATTYPHHSEYSGTDKIGGKIVVHYNTISTYRLMEGITSDGSGLLAHEFLHSLGYADLYDNSEKRPVWTWSIMGSNSRYVQWPLAYERMHFSSWISIDTITESGEYTLDVQDKADGNQAYIIQSDLNSQEIFVVEYRKINKEKNYEENLLDTKIGDYYNETGGIIVYRINKTIPNLNNSIDDGKDAVYVFRPQNLPDPTESYVNKDAVAATKAALSKENGRTSIGSDDWNATLKDGALTFSDGTNSGIVISTDSSGKGDQMKFTVEMPDTSVLDSWNDMGFNDNSYSLGDLRMAAVAKLGDTLYLNAFSYSGHKAETFKFDGSNWTKIDEIAVSGNTPYLKSFIMNNKLFMSCISDGNLNIYRFENNTSQRVFTKAGIWHDYDVAVDGNKAWIGYKNEDDTTVLGCFDGANMTTAGEVFQTDFMCGAPKVEVLNGVPYIAYRNASGKKVSVYKYENGKYTDMGGNFTADNMDLAVSDNALFLSTVIEEGEEGKEKVILYMHRLSADTWYTDEGTPFNSVSADLTTSQGNIYFMYMSNEDNGGNTAVYQYDTDNCKFVQEGTKVDVKSESASLINDGAKLIVSYAINGRIIVKTKTLANELKSLTITPPDKVYYQVGENLDLTGMKVVANYVKNSKELAGGTYSVSGYNKSEAGRQSVTVSYEGVSNAFEVEVKNKLQEPEPEHQHNLTKTEAKAKTCHASGNTEYWTCNSCGKYFADSKGETEITKADWNIPSSHETEYCIVHSGYMRDGYECDKCKNCGQMLNYKLLPGYSTSYVKSFRVSKGKKCFTAKWKKQSKKNQKQFSGYQIRYSTDPNLNGAVYGNIGRSKGSVKIKNLGKKVRYYVQLRTYTNGFYSPWSAVKAVVTK